MKPGLLAALHLAFAWLPIAFALYAMQSLLAFLDQGFLLGRAPVHALSIGFFGSMLVAMVTRVTQGHSGRPLQMGVVPWITFVLLQVVALVRIHAEVGPDAALWLVIAAFGWLVAFFVVLTLGELYILPTGLGLFAKLAPPRLGATTVASWFLAIFSGSLLAGLVGTLWSKAGHPAFFLLLAALAVAAAALLWRLDRPIRALP